jgi:hypothetical protein
VNTQVSGQSDGPQLTDRECDNVLPGYSYRTSQGSVLDMEHWWNNQWRRKKRTRIETSSATSFTANVTWIHQILNPRLCGEKATSNSLNCRTALLICSLCKVFIKVMFKNQCGARSSIVGWGTMLQAVRSRVRLPVKSLDFNWSNPSSHSMALGSTQPLTEISTRNLPGGKGWPTRKGDSLAAIC